MVVVVLYLIVALTACCSEVSQSDLDTVDPWDVVTDYDFSQSRVALESKLPPVDRALRLAQKDIKYFQEDQEPWEKPDPGEDHLMGFNYTAWNKTYIRPPKGFGDKQTTKLMKTMLTFLYRCEASVQKLVTTKDRIFQLPDFDITKLKLKPDKKNNESMYFAVLMKPGPENKIVGYSSKRLYVQIHAPCYKGAADNELGRYLSKILCISRSLIKIRQGAGQNIRKVRVPKSAIQETVYVRKLLNEFALEKQTEKYDA